MLSPQLKVLVLCRETSLHWAPLYIAAFCERCDVITAGPALPDDAHVEWRLPNDILTNADTLAEIFPLLPDEWLPDYIIAIQSGGPLIQDIAQAPCPTGYISVDSWHDPMEMRNARPYDAVFVAQRALAPYFVEAGCRNVHWLPLACSPEKHHPVPMEPLVDFSFAGTLIYVVDRERVARLLRLREHFSVDARGGLGGAAYCEALSQGRSIFNSSVAQDVNMRVFEAMAVGRPLLTNRDAAVNGLDALFEEGVHYLGYDDGDLLAQARRLVEDPALRQHLADNARRAVLARHTYGHRVETMLQVLATCHSQAPIPHLSGLLPRDARRVLDIGLRLERSRVALRRQGVEQVFGMLLPGQSLERERSFDGVFGWRDAATPPVDAIVCGAPLSMATLEQVLDLAHHALQPGGALGLLCPAETTLSSPQPAPDVPGFALVSFEQWEDGATAVRLRRCDRTPEALSQDIFARFPGGGQ